MLLLRDGRTRDGEDECGEQATIYAAFASVH
jgi:hypothetical protein